MTDAFHLSVIVTPRPEPWSVRALPFALLKTFDETIEAGDEPRATAILATATELHVFDLNDAMTDGATKRAAVDALRAYAAQHQAVAVALAAEVWVSRQNAVAPSESPDRREAMILTLETLSVPTQTQEIPILTESGKRRLAVEKSAVIDGVSIFDGILPQRAPLSSADRSKLN